MINTIVGAEIQTRHLLASLGAGEEHHIARALAAEACYTVSTRLSGEARARALVQRAIELAESLDDDVGIVWARSGQVVTAYLCGHFPEARETTEKAGRDLLRRSPWRAWELVSLQLYNLWSLFQCGEAAELKHRVPAVLRDAHQRGDLYTVANVSTGVPNFAWLVDDRIDEARAAMTQAMQDWSPSDFTLQHYWELIGLTHVDLYAGQPEPALARLLERWSALERSLLLRMPFVRIEGSWLKARAHLGAAAIGRDRARNLAAARRLARRMARIAPWSKALADLVYGGVAALRGESERAADIFATAAAQFDALGMSLHAIVARHRCGALRGGDEGARLMREADAEMRAQEIVRPDRVIAMFAPDAPPG
jgi:eukaryotic-like serine/threonine-protein kinase